MMMPFTRRRIFGGRMSDPKAQQILDALRRRPEEMTRKQIYDDVFARNISGDRMAEAFKLLFDAKFAVAKTEETGGRHAERWFAC
jgi:hypothetical protein